MRTGISPYVARRSVLLGAAASVIAGKVCAQTDPVATEILLTRNLFTRVSTPVLINSQGPFNFVIDTGSATTAVSDVLAQELSLPERASLMVHGIAESVITTSVGIDRLSLRGLVKRDLRCPVFPRDQLGADGLIGLDVLGRFRLNFDTVRRTARLSQIGLQISSSGLEAVSSRLSRHPVRSVRGRFGQMIITNLQVGGHAVAAFIDSGAQYSIGNHALQRVMETRRGVQNSARIRSVSLFGVTGQSLRADVARVDDLRVGQHRLGPATLLFANLHCFETLGLSGRPALLIGADILGRFRRIEIDFAGNAVSFEGVRPPSNHPLDELAAT